jgi:hypothetical protein
MRFRLVFHQCSSRITLSINYHATFCDFVGNQLGIYGYLSLGPDIELSRMRDGPNWLTMSHVPCHPLINNHSSSSSIPLSIEGKEQMKPLP